MSIGKRISIARKDMNLTQEELADLIKVSRQSISKWESDLVIPDTENIIALGKTLDVSFEWLVTGNTNTRKAQNKINYIFILVGMSFLLILIVILALDSKLLGETSSVIQINGSGILITLSMIFIVIGLILTYKKRK